MNLARLADQEREGGPLFDVSPRDWLTLPLAACLVVLAIAVLVALAVVVWAEDKMRGRHGRPPVYDF